VRQIRIILLAAFLLTFTAFIWINPAPMSVNFWPDRAGFLHFDWPVGFLALVFFLLGFLPTWAGAYWRQWRLKRRVAYLESMLSKQASASLSSTQLDAASKRASENP